MRDRLINLISGAGYDYDDFIEESHERGLSVTEDFEEWCADYLIANDVVPVVRCEQCKFYEEVEYYHPTEKASKNVCRLIKRQMQPDDYCSYGERKDAE